MWQFSIMISHKFLSALNFSSPGVWILIKLGSGSGFSNWSRIWIHTSLLLLFYHAKYFVRVPQNCTDMNMYALFVRIIYSPLLLSEREKDKFLPISTTVKFYIFQDKMSFLRKELQPGTRQNIFSTVPNY